LKALEQRRVVSCLSRDAFVDRINKEVNLAGRARQYLRCRAWKRIWWMLCCFTVCCTWAPRRTSHGLAVL